MPTCGSQSQLSGNLPAFEPLKEPLGSGSKGLINQGHRDVFISAYKGACIRAFCVCRGKLHFLVRAYNWLTADTNHMNIAGKFSSSSS